MKSEERTPQIGDLLRRKVDKKLFLVIGHGFGRAKGREYITLYSIKSHTKKNYFKELLMVHYERVA
jgi:hypothetical protein